MDTNGNDIELTPFITFIKLARWQKGTNAQLRRELEKVTAERDELQQRLDSISKLPVIELPQHRRISRTGSLSRDII